MKTNTENIKSNLLVGHGIMKRMPVVDNTQISQNGFTDYVQQKHISH